MARKVIAIGNRLMGDDGIGLRVAEYLQEDLQENFGIEVICGETDVDFCLAQIEDGDDVYVIDSTWLGQSPGTISVHRFEHLNLHGQVNFSLHQLNLFPLLQLEKIQINGFLIGIEVQELGFSLELSPSLQASFETISDRVYREIGVLVEAR